MNDPVTVDGIHIADSLVPVGRVKNIVILTRWAVGPRFDEREAHFGLSLTKFTESETVRNVVGSNLAVSSRDFSL